MTAQESVLEGIVAGAPAVPVADLPMLLLGAGLLVGLYHAIEPDHVAAMVAITGKHKNKNASRRGAGARGSIYGLIWGAGHTSAIFLLAVAIFAFSARIPDQLFAIFEVAVGVMLIALGISVISDDRRLRFLALLRLHAHPHTHDDGTTHTHAHAHPHTHDGRTLHRHGHRSYLVGCIHGLAGSGGLVAFWMSSALLTDSAAATAQSATVPAEAHVPLLLLASMFGAGSMLGMAAVAGALSMVLAVCGSTDSARRVVRCVSGATAIAFGAYVIVSITAIPSPAAA